MFTIFIVIILIQSWERLCLHWASCSSAKTIILSAIKPGLKHCHHHHLCFLSIGISAPLSSWIKCFSFFSMWVPKPWKLPCINEMPSSEWLKTVGTWSQMLPISRLPIMIIASSIWQCICHQHWHWRRCIALEKTLVEAISCLEGEEGDVEVKIWNMKIEKEN